MPVKVNLDEKFGMFDEYWTPRIVGRYNDNEIRLAKASGDFQWHRHENSDELFLVIDGILEMQFRDSVERIGPGEMIVVPRGVEHLPRVPDGEVRMLIVDPADTPNTGDPATAAKVVEI